MIRYIASGILYALLGTNNFSCCFAFIHTTPSSPASKYMYRSHLDTKTKTCQRIFASSSAVVKPFLYSYSQLKVSTEPNPNESKEAEEDSNVSPNIDSAVLQKLYPSLLEYIEQYGHPNIPLGSTEGRACYTLRRLKIQGSLTDNDVDVLTKLGFRFTFDHIYEEMDFEDMLGRLLAYESEHKANYQIPKKYPPDPELGAWVAAVRRIGRDAIDATEREALDDIGFAWVSKRKCGSKFMNGFRELKSQFVKELGTDAEFETLDYQDDFKEIWGKVLSANTESERWLVAQRDAHRLGKLSDARVAYMDQLLGLDWREC